MTTMTERRATPATVELRADGEGMGRAVGYASVFGAEYDVGGWFTERVDPAAFNKTIGEADVRALFNHDPDHLLGRSSARTLQLSIDTRGLAYTIDLPDTTLARDVRELLSRGDITGSSFAFRVIREEWESKEDGSELRTLLEVQLFDVGPVTFPASPSTDAGLRAIHQLAESRSIDPGELVSAFERREASGLLAPSAPDVVKSVAPRRFVA